MLKSSSCPACRRWRWRSSSRMPSSADFMLWPSRTFTRHRADALEAPAAHALDAVAEGRQRHDDHVVLVLPDRVLALAREHADDRQRHLLDADGLVDRVGLAEQLLGDRLADDRHLARAGDLAGLEDAALGERPVAHLEVVARRCRTPGCSSWRCPPPPARRCAARAPPPAPRAPRGRWRCASSSVSVWPVCAPRRTPPCDCAPGSTSMMFEPRPLICSSTRCCAPAADRDHRDHRRRRR